MKNDQANKTSQKRRFAIFIGIVAVVVLVAYFFGGDIADTVVGMSYQPTSEMSSLISSIELTGDGSRILNASKPALQTATDFNQNCPSTNEKSSTLGCYYDRQIYIYAINNDELAGIKESTLAHELLHAVWARLSAAQKMSLQSDLDTVYKAHEKDLSDHMKLYSDDDYYDELHSVVGTQISYSELSSALQSHYAKYFTDQTKIAKYFDNYNSKFTALQTRADELDAQITANKKTIETKTATYQADLAQLTQYITDFNRAAGDGTFQSEASFNIERDKLLSRRQDVVDEYDELEKLIDDTNTLVKEYNENVARSSELFDSINSNVSAPSSSVNQSQK